MNLDEWDKLSRDEQQSMLAQGKGRPQSVKWPESELDKPAGYFRNARHRPVDADTSGLVCCDAVNTLIDQLPDEREGVEFYSKMSGQMAIQGEYMIAEVLKEISDQEYKHFLLLVGVIDQLTESCGCKKIHIPPIGG